MLITLSTSDFIADIKAEDCCVKEMAYGEQCQVQSKDKQEGRFGQTGSYSYQGNWKSFCVCLRRINSI